MVVVKNNAMTRLIDPQILLSTGAVFRRHEKSTVIFHEGNFASFYYQIISGSVSMTNRNDDGSAFIQGIFQEGQSFGTSALMLGERYPASAIAASDVELLRLCREPFLDMLQQHPDVLLNLTLSLSRKLYQRAFIGKCIASEGPEDRIYTLLRILKKESGCPGTEKFRLRFSRQQIADMIGLRVETVIRAIKRLEEKGLVVIVHGKVYY